jgi:hypothetical protein
VAVEIVVITIRIQFVLKPPLIDIQTFIDLLPGSILLEIDCPCIRLEVLSYALVNGTPPEKPK